MTEQMRKALNKAACVSVKGWLKKKVMFVMGADWYRNNVWHDASKELPEKGKNVLASTLSPEGRGIMEGGVTMVVDRGLLECDRSHKSTFKAWAYLDDLLPDKENGIDKTLKNQKQEVSQAGV